MSMAKKALLPNAEIQLMPIAGDVIVRTVLMKQNRIYSLAAIVGEITVWLIMADMNVRLRDRDKYQPPIDET
jgi:hypothetical protein